MELLKWFLGIIIALWFLWYFTGGPARYEREHPGPYVEPPAYDQKTPAYKDPTSGKTYGDPNANLKDYFK